MFTMILWGRIADRYGRKPVLVFSLTGMAAMVTLFGASRTIWQMMMFRSLAGLFSGSVVFVYPISFLSDFLILSLILNLLHFTISDLCVYSGNQMLIS
jgi:MFS family permease